MTFQSHQIKPREKYLVFFSETAEAAKTFQVSSRDRLCYTVVGIFQHQSIIVQIVEILHNYGLSSPLIWMHVVLHMSNAEFRPLDLGHGQRLLAEADVRTVHYIGLLGYLDNNDCRIR